MIKGERGISVEGKLKGSVPDCGDASNPSLTSPYKLVMGSGTFGPRHISLKGLALHRSLNQADILQEYNGHSMVIE
jgi:hypothetical protein